MARTAQSRDLCRSLQTTRTLLGARGRGGQRGAGRRHAKKKRRRNRSRQWGGRDFTPFALTGLDMIGDQLGSYGVNKLFERKKKR